MSDKSSESGLLKLWQRIAGGITAITGFIAGLLGFIQLVQGNAGLATTLLLIVGIGLLWVACLYYARFWKPEAKDQGPAKPSSFLPDEERRQYELELKKFQGQQARRQTRRKMIRRSALIGVIIIPLLLLAGFLTWQQVQNLPTKEVVILVAEFDGPEPQNYRVTETILSNLRDETETHDDVKIATLDQPITEQDGSDTARAAGEEQRATIVIWGWYGKTAETVPISVNFEVLNPPEYLPKIGETARGEVQTFALGELDSFQLQTRLSAEMVYLTLFTLGMARYAAEDWHGAIKFFTDALNQVDESATALDQSSVYFYRGNSQYLQNNFEQAIADLSQALQLDPEYASAYNNRGNAHYNKGNYEQAIDDYNQALQLDLEYAIAYNNRGNAHYNKGNYEQAIDDLSRALQIDPEYAVAYYNRGNAHSVQGNYEQAIDDYNQAIQLDPEYAIAYNNRGNAHSDQGDYEQAIDDYNQALQIDPEYAVAYYNRGNAHSDQGDYEQAIDDYNQAIQLDLESAVAYNNRGNAHSDQGNYEQAIDDYNQALQIDPEYASAYNNRGNAHSDQGNYEQAIDDYNQAIQLDPEFAFAYFGRGGAHYDQGDYEQAIDDYSQALQIAPEATDAYYERGFVYRENGNRNAAINDFEKVLELTDDPELRRDAEQQLQELGVR